MLELGRRALTPAPFFVASLFFVFLTITDVAVQANSRYYDHWFFGDSIGISFDCDTPYVTQGSLSTNEGVASISDPCSGELLFYTDGVRVWNRSHQVMKNGTGLKGNESSTQSALIVPMPGNPDRYYLFTSDADSFDKLPHVGVHYSVIDMNGGNGLGEIVEKNIPLLHSVAEKLVGILHQNGEDFWVVGYELEGSNYYAWKVSSDGISAPVVTNIPYSGLSESVGYLKASPDGRYLFSIMHRDTTGLLMEFDNGTGKITGVLTQLTAWYGASFSPNSKYLYSAREIASWGVYNLVRYTLSLNNPESIVASEQVLKSLKYEVAAMQIGPDGNIYVALLPNLIARINNPNTANPSVDVSAFLFFGPGVGEWPVRMGPPQ